MQKIKQILITLVLLSGLLLVNNLILAWTSPSANPPSSNVFMPINVGTAGQYKEGALGIGGVFRAYSAVQFDSLSHCTLKTDASGVLLCGDDGEIEVFTSDGTWTNPGYDRVMVILAGGGGGGYGGVNPWHGGGGGQGGQCLTEIIDVSLVTSVYVTVGNGGNGGNYGGGGQSNGETSQFGTLLTAGGGVPGYLQDGGGRYDTTHIGGGRGGASWQDEARRQAGNAGAYGNAGENSNGGGGGGSYGNGASGGGNSPGDDALPNTGGGGGGGGQNGSTGWGGGDGGDGICIIIPLQASGSLP